MKWRESDLIFEVFAIFHCNLICYGYLVRCRWSLDMAHGTISDNFIFCSSREPRDVTNGKISPIDAMIHGLTF